MADAPDEQTERDAVRHRFQAEQDRLAAISDEEWVSRRDDEVRHVRAWADRHRTAA